jgi:large subunit ribosomal protein L15
MFTINDLPKVVSKKKKRLGRGEGSRVGKNCGAGNKGQLKRSGKMKVYFSGTTSDAGASILSRNPKKRGFKALPKKQLVSFSLNTLARHYKDKETVSIKSLLEKGLITEKINKIRVYLSNEMKNKVSFMFDKNSNIHLTKGVEGLIN